MLVGTGGRSRPEELCSPVVLVLGCSSLISMRSSCVVECSDIGAEAVTSWEFSGELWLLLGSVTTTCWVPTWKFCSQFKGENFGTGSFAMSSRHGVVSPQQRTGSTGSFLLASALKFCTVLTARTLTGIPSSFSNPKPPISGDTKFLADGWKELASVWAIHHDLKRNMQFLLFVVELACYEVVFTSAGCEALSISMPDFWAAIAPALESFWLFPAAMPSLWASLERKDLVGLVLILSCPLSLPAALVPNFEWFPEAHHQIWYSDLNNSVCCCPPETETTYDEQFLRDSS